VLGVPDENWKRCGILVVDAVDLDALMFGETCQPDALPMEQVVRAGDGDAGPWADKAV
jgi:hypothetical protein